MNKILVLLLVALCSRAAVPRERDLAQHLGDVAFVQRDSEGLGLRLRMDAAPLMSDPAAGAVDPSPITVVLIGLAAGCFIAVRRRS